ncbi:hypothetical protein Ancab_006366 [Ancistrocladus abbreviatus]
METSALLSKALPSLTLHSPTIPKHSRSSKCGLHRENQVGKICAIQRSNSYGSDYKGRLVDENLIVLRKRIHEMKMIERNYEPPSNWSEWEKQYYTCYDEYICKVLGVLQAHLMNTRPSVALGTLVLLAMSVPTSVVLLALQFMEVADKIVASTHGA